MLPVTSGGAAWPLSPEEGSQGRNFTDREVKQRSPALFHYPKPQKRPNPKVTARKTCNMCTSRLLSLSLPLLVSREWKGLK